MKKRIEDELRVNEGRITEERLNIIAADFVTEDDHKNQEGWVSGLDQMMMEKEIEIENMITEMGGTIIR